MSGTSPASTYHFASGSSSGVPDHERARMINFQRAVLDNVRRNLAEVPLASRTRDEMSGQSIQDILIRELRGTLMRDVREPRRAVANIESYLKDCKAVSENPTLLMTQIFRESLSLSSTSGTSGPILAGLEQVCNEARDILLKAKDAGQASTAADFVVSQAWVESKVAWGEATQEAAKNRLRDFEALTNPLNDSDRTSLPDLAYRVVASHLGEVFSLGRMLGDGQSGRLMEVKRGKCDGGRIQLESRGTRQ